MHNLEAHDTGIIMLKPESFPVDISWFKTQEIVERLILENSLSIIQVLEKQLTERQILLIYNDMYCENDSSKVSTTLAKIRIQLMEYMLSWPIRSYLLTWDDALNKILNIKKYIREILYSNKVIKEPVRNVIHAPEKSEIQINLAVLFGIEDVQNPFL